MKTLFPLATVVLAVSLNVFAADALLSPRAQENQIKTAATVDNSVNTVTQNRNVLASPRAKENQIKTVKGTDNSPSTIASGCAIGSPKQLEQAGKFTSGDCCKVTSVRCTSPKSCCIVASK